MDDVVKSEKRKISKSVKARSIAKIGFDSKHRNLSTISLELLKTDGVILVSEGAVMTDSSVYFVFGRGSLQNALSALINKGVDKLPISADHEPESIIKGVLGYVDIANAKLVTDSNDTNSLTAPIVLDSNSIVVKELKRQQDLGLNFGVSISFSYSENDFELVTLDNNQVVEVIRNFDIIDLSIVREGAIVSANNIKFNLQNMENQNEEIKTNEVVADNATVDSTGNNNVESENLTEVITSVIEEKEKEVAEITKVAEDAKAEVETAKAEVENLKAQIANIKSVIKVKSLSTHNKELAPTTITPYTGTTFNPDPVDLSWQKSVNDAIVLDVLSNDNEAQFPWQPTDHTTGDYKPVVRSNEFYGWTLSTFTPATQCCWAVDVTGKAGTALFSVGSLCNSVSTNIYETMYSNNSQGLNYGVTGLSPLQIKDEKSLSVLNERILYSMIQGDSTAPVSEIANCDGLTGVFSVAPTSIVSSGSIIAPLEAIIQRFSVWFNGEVGIDGSGLVAYMHPFTAQALAEEMKRRLVSFATDITLTEASQLMSTQSATSYKGIRIVTSSRFIMDVTNTATAGTTEIYVTVEGNVGGRVRYINDVNNRFVLGNTPQPVKIGANTLSAVPNCQLDTTYAYFAVLGAYAKSRFKLAKITNVQSLPYGSSVLNGIRDIVGINFSRNFTGN